MNKKINSNSKPVLIHNKLFYSKKAAKKYIKYLISKEEINKPISDKNKEFVLSLLELHHNFKEKIGCGVEYIYVRKDPLFGNNREFCIKRTDGSIENFSWHKALS
jgi:DNA-directed RNA polymerase-4 subunit 1